MNQEKDYLQDLTEIRSMMEKSTRFISLSGLSGVFAGIVALIGAGIAYWLIDDFFKQPIEGFVNYRLLELKLIMTASAVLLLALWGGYFFTARKAKRQGQKVWTKSTRQVVLNLLFPLFTGGIFCIALYYYELIVFIAPATLIFYGLALINSSKFTLDDIRYLGYLQTILGLISLFFLGYGLYFWAFGFGVLHIVYGISMYYKYEHKK